MACAIGPGAELEQVCVLEIAQDADGGEVLVIHDPGGGFRRVKRDAGGLLPLDGADPLVILSDDPESGTEFTLAGDRYRLPAPAGKAQ